METKGRTKKKETEGGMKKWKEKSGRRGVRARRERTSTNKKRKGKERTHNDSFGEFQGHGSEELRHSLVIQKSFISEVFHPEEGIVVAVIDLSVVTTQRGRDG